MLALAEEAGVKRHLLTHRHIDLKDEFYARVRAQGSVPASEVRLRKDLDAASAANRELRAELRSARDELAKVYNVNNILEAENLTFRRILEGKERLNVSILRPGGKF